MILQGEVSRTGRGIEADDEYLSLSTLRCACTTYVDILGRLFSRLRKLAIPERNGLEIELKRIRFHAKNDANVSNDVVHSVSDLIGSDRRPRNRTNRFYRVQHDKRLSKIIRGYTFQGSIRKKHEKCWKYLNKTFIN